jgi:hypothetical protein
MALALGWAAATIAGGTDTKHETPPWRVREILSRGLWMRLFQATSDSVHSPGSAGVMAIGRSTSLPL